MAATPQKSTSTTPRTRPSGKKHPSPASIEEAVASARKATMAWTEDYAGDPARGSLLNVLRQTIRRMEQAEHGLRAAQMIAKGGTIDG
jgi:hypothetical protein